MMATTESAFSQSQLNDNFADRETSQLTSGTVNGTNVSATKESGEPAHAGNSGGKSVWFEWTAQLTGDVIFNTSGSSFDTLLAVYTGSAVNSLTAVASNDDRPADLTSQVVFTATVGNVYQIAVDGFAASSGDIVLNWQFVQPPPRGFTTLSTRTHVGTGDTVLISGFIITGALDKTVVVRARGPSISGVSGALTNPVMELYNSGGEVIASNNDWKDTQRAEIEATARQPANDRESAILRTLEPGPYTTVIRGSGGGTGVGLVEVFDVDDSPNAQLANISTRATAGSGDEVIVGGFTIAGPNPLNVIVRAIGSSLASFGIPNGLADLLSCCATETVISWRSTTIGRTRRRRRS